MSLLTMLPPVDSSNEDIEEAGRSVSTALEGSMIPLGSAPHLRPTSLLAMRGRYIKDYI